MRTGSVCLVLAVLTAACLPPTGRLFRTTVSSPDGSYELPVVLGDTSNLVIRIEPAPLDPPIQDLLAVQADPDDPRTIIATWIGGACDDEAALSFRRSGLDYELHLDVRRRFGACMGLGVLRAVRIVLFESVPPGSIRATGPG